MGVRWVLWVCAILVYTPFRSLLKSLFFAHELSKKHTHTTQSKVVVFEILNPFLRSRLVLGESLKSRQSRAAHVSA